MPRKPSLEIKLWWNKCKEYTQTTNPIIIKKEAGNRFHIKSVCLVCNKYKNKYLNIEQVNLLPDEIKKAPDNTAFTENIIKDGNALPLLTLIPAIFAGIQALTSVGQRGEVTRVHGPNPRAGNKQTETHGGTITSLPEPAVLSDREKPAERTLSDDELINKSIEFLTGKGFCVSI